MKRRAVVFVAWGDRFVAEVAACLERSPYLAEFDNYLITDLVTAVDIQGLQVVRVDFANEGLARKVEMVEHLPAGYDSYVFLDSDTTVIADLELGFRKAETHGMALAPAPHYSLDHFWGFDAVLRTEGIEPMGQLQYNTGVVFFSLTDETRHVFDLWRTLTERHWNIVANDQPYLSLAFEESGFLPYVLSISYNYRGFGEPISGIVRVWHSHGSMPRDLNDFDDAWPPRRAVPGRVLRSTHPVSAALEHARHIARKLFRRD